MSYQMDFQGGFSYPNELALERGLDALQAWASNSSVIEVRNLRVAGCRVEVGDVPLSAPASMWDPTLLALGALAEGASEGEVVARFRGDTIEETRVVPPPSSRASGSGEARHHNWALLMAVLADDPDAVGAALEAGADPGAELVWYGGEHALHLAAEAGRAAVVERLLAGGADPNAKTRHGRVPLELATDPAVRQALEAAGAEAVDLETSWRLVGRACCDGREDEALALHRDASLTGAKPTQWVMFQILRCGLDRMFAALDGSPWVDVFREEEGWDVEEWSTTLGGGGSLEMLDALRARGVALDLPSVAVYAALEGHLALLARVLDEPGVVEACHPGGERDAMGAAAGSSRVEAMALLHDKGVPLIPEPRFYGSPLHDAAGERRGALPALRWLLDHGVPVDLRDAHGRTALHRAARMGTVEAMVELVARGLDPSVTSNNGERAYRDSPDGRAKHRRFVAALRERGLPLPAPL